jgi:5S rRNA maturation endonuclease (ribonuclease M5)
MEQCEEKSVLLVEGSDDYHIIDKFCKDNAININFGFCNCQTDNQVLSKLNALLKESESPEVIGVILDADNDIDARYQEIKNKVQNFYTEFPNSIPKTGLIHKGEGLPKLGIWIMPNNQDNGALENFYLDLATGIDANFIGDIIRQAENKNLTSFKKQHRQKVIMHTYFAWQDRPGAPLYAAINNIVLNNTDTAKVFKSWLVKLFS